MNSSVIVFPGSNCDRDIANSIFDITGKKVKLVWYKEVIPANTDLVIIPGGFSFGDYLRSGAIASTSKIMKQITSFVKKGVPVIGICNGFQILTEAKLLPGTLILNDSLKFVCKEVNLKVESKNSIFTKNIKKNTIKLPIAHKMGNYRVTRLVLEQLIENQQIAFRYSDSKGKCDDNSNPNGSIYNIAGILDENKKVLGMMPHPERYTSITNKDKIMKEILKMIL